MFWNKLSEAERLVVLTRVKFDAIRYATDQALLELSKRQREALANVRAHIASKQTGN